jgi:hypothetical protein
MIITEYNKLAQVPANVQIPEPARKPNIFARVLSAVGELLNRERSSTSLQLQPQPLQDTSEELAQKIIQHVQGIVLFSSNYPDRSPVLQQKSYEDLQCSLHAIYDVSSKIWNEYYYIENPQSWLSSLVALVTKYNVGNCGEMAAVGLQYAIDHLASQRVEMFHILGGNHRFLVIGRDEGTDPADYLHWGPNAVVCDPWASRSYPAVQIEQTLQDFRGTEDYPGEGRLTLLEMFDPARQRLSPFNPVLSWSNLPLNKTT